jgi:hypothetical protein
LLAATEKHAPSLAMVLALARPRLKMDGIIMPAETTSMPSFIIALRESFMIINLS